MSDSWKGLLLNHYQALASQTATYPQDKKLEYLILGLTGEAGEVANKYKKMLRDGVDLKAAIIDEMGDVLWYLAMLAYEFDVKLSDVAEGNIEKLRARKATGTISSKHRTPLTTDGQEGITSS